MWDPDRVVDGLGRGLDKGIVKACQLFNEAGFATNGSCQGHTGRACPGAWITFDGSHLDDLTSLAWEFNEQSSSPLEVRVWKLCDNERGKFVVRVSVSERGDSVEEYDSWRAPLPNTWSAAEFGKASRKLLTQFAAFVSRNR